MKLIKDVGLNKNGSADMNTTEKGDIQEAMSMPYFQKKYQLGFLLSNY